MHRDLIDHECLNGMERGLSCKQFVAELHDRGLSPDHAAETVCQLFASTAVRPASTSVRIRPGVRGPRRGAELPEPFRSRGG